MFFIRSHISNIHRCTCLFCGYPLHSSYSCFLLNKDRKVSAVHLEGKSLALSDSEVKLEKMRVNFSIRWGRHFILWSICICFLLILKTLWEDFLNKGEVSFLSCDSDFGVWNVISHVSLPLRFQENGSGPAYTSHW